MADELVAITYQDVHAAEGMLGIIVVETFTECAAPQFA